MNAGVSVDSEQNIPQFLAGDPQEVKDNLVGYAKRLEGRITGHMYLDADKFIQGHTEMFDAIHASLGDRVMELGRRIATMLGGEIPDHSPEHAGKFLNLVVALVLTDELPPAEFISPDGSVDKKPGLQQLATDAAQFTSTTAVPVVAANMKHVVSELGKSRTSALAQFMQYVDIYESKGGKDSTYISKLFAESPVDLQKGESAGMALGYLASKSALLPQLVSEKFRSEYRKLDAARKEAYVEDAISKLLLVYDMRKAVAEHTVGKILGQPVATAGNDW